MSSMPGGTGPLLVRPAPEATTSRLAGLGLDERVDRALDGSFVAGLAQGSANWLHDRLKPWLEASWAARHAEKLSLGAVMLLMALSPFVGTGINAALVLLATMMVLLRFVALPEARAQATVLDALVLAFVAVHLVSAGASSFLVPSLKGLAKMGIYWLAYFSFRQVLQTRQATLAVLGALIFAGGLEAAYGVYQWIIGVEPLANWEDPEALDPLTRVYSTLMNPNLLAGYLVPIVALSGAVAAIKTGLTRQLALATMLVGIVCTYFTYCRSAYLAFAAMAVVAAGMLLMGFWAKLRQQAWALPAAIASGVGLVGALGLGLLLSPALQARVGSIFTLRGHSSNSYRMNVWIGVVQMVQDHLILGVGIGNSAFRKMYGLYMVSGYDALGAYNVWLEVLAEMGLVGLTVFVALTVAVAARFWVAWRHGKTWASALALGGFLALVGMGVMGVVDTVFYRPSVQLQFWLLVALAASLAITPESRLRTPQEKGAP